MLTLEGVYQGESDYLPKPVGWMRGIYIAEDGTEHGRAFVVTPHYDDVVEQNGVAAEPPSSRSSPSSSRQRSRAEGTSRSSTTCR